MSKFRGDIIAMDISRVLGIDPTNIASLHIILDAGDVAHVIVKRLLVTEDIKPLIESLKKYKLKVLDD